MTGLINNDRVLTWLVVFLFIGLDAAAHNPDGPANANITFKMAGSNNDSLFALLYVNTILIPSNETANDYDARKYAASQDKAGQYSFSLDISKPCYISIGNRYENTPIGKILIPLLDKYLIEPGDNITIVATSDTTRKFDMRKNDSYFYYVYENAGLLMSFTGKGAEKYKYKYESDQMNAAIKNESAVLNKTGDIRHSLFVDECFENSVTILNKYRKALSDIEYYILYADIIGKYKADWYELFVWDWVRSDKSNDYLTNAKQSLKKRINSDLDKEIPMEAKSRSLYYPAYLIQRQVAIAFADSNRYENNVYQSLKSITTGYLRDKVLTTYLMSWLSYLKDKSGILGDAMITISDSYYYKKIDELSNREVKGKQAYNFSLVDVNGKKISLKDFSGKVVFLDFWYTGCDKCSYYYQKVLSEVEEEYRDNSQIVFVTICIDVDKERWMKSVSNGMYTSQWVTNLYTEGEGGNHEVIQAYNVTGYPRPILIDKEGKIFNTSVVDLRNKEKLRSILEDAILYQLNVQND